MRVPPAFLTLAEAVICHSDPARFDLAYRLLWRLQTEKHLLGDVSGPDIVRAHAMQKSVGRDSHKMKAFVRFKELPETGDRRRFIAWFEPEHFIVARVAPFFQRRFTDMDWIIATPKGSAVWDGDTLRTSDEAAEKPEIVDDTDDLWRTYFAHIFNPARLKVKMMQSEMPKKYWKNLPEAELIPDLIRDAEQRVRDMAEREASNSMPKFHAALQRRSFPSPPRGEGGA
ncbi:TIGR03915 family putative DNA repair protein [Asticcacaulis sp. YBE204]|uniref:TIGR03915 family putative DNA repair protein n=1 Tax=Asticcacaulis sp. YBE204 TaxID=1282363 RepID=UPI0021019F5A|nr:TIGR03915 family putative DNA repair protein [Asticcacaulis sp. YBE204]